MFDILRSKVVSNRVFCPRSTFAEPTMTVAVGGARIACHIVGRNNDSGTILHFHGNGEVASDYLDSLSERFLECGLNFCFAEYRGYGASSGSPNLVDALADNIRIVEELDIPLKKLVVYGRSLGSLFAIDLAARLPDIAGVVLESGIASFLEDWPLVAETKQLGITSKQLTDEVEALFDNQRKLAKYSGHLLVLHAENDNNLDPSHARRLYSWANTRNKRLVIFPTGDHSTILMENLHEIVCELSEFGDRIGIK